LNFQNNLSKKNSLTILKNKGRRKVKFGYLREISESETDDFDDKI
jgi:hypothetical protein